MDRPGQHAPLRSGGKKGKRKPVAYEDDWSRRRKGDPGKRDENNFSQSSNNLRYQVISADEDPNPNKFTMLLKRLCAENRPICIVGLATILHRSGKRKRWS